MTLSIYSVTHDFLSVLSGLQESDGELTQESIEAALKNLPMDRETNIAAFCKNIEQECLVIAEHQRKLRDRKLFLEKKLEAYKDFLLCKMKENGITKIECDEFLINIKKNPPALVIDDESHIPPLMNRVKVEIDKNMVKDAIKNGGYIPGVRLESTERVEIKGRGE